MPHTAPPFSKTDVLTRLKRMLDDDDPEQLRADLRDLIDQIQWRAGIEDQDLARQQALVLNQIQDCVTLTDLNGTITYVNRAQKEARTLPHDAALGQPVAAYGDQPETGATQQEIFTATLTQGAWQGRVVNVRSDGTHVPVNLRTALIQDEAGQPIALAGIATDITEQLQAEQALRTSRQQLASLIDFLPDATLAIDLDQRIILWNKAIEVMTGIPAAQMLGRRHDAYAVAFYGERRPTLLDFVLGDDLALAAQYDDLMLEGDAATAEAFCPTLHHQGGWIFGKASLLRDPSGNVIGAIETIRDITERKRAEAAHRQSRDLFSLFMRHSPVYI